MYRFLPLVCLALTTTWGVHAQEDRDCTAEADAYFGSMNDLVHGPGAASNCSTDLPGEWTDCPDTCAAAMLAALDELDCCWIAYINLFAGPGDHGMYTQNAFNNVIAICDGDFSNAVLECPAPAPTEPDSTETTTEDNGRTTTAETSTEMTDSTSTEMTDSTSTEMTDSTVTEPQPTTVDCLAAATAFYGSDEDVLRGEGITDPCPSGLPGSWEVCSTECATGMQIALDELDCCFRDYLGQYAPGSGSYPDQAFTRVIPLCELDLTNAEGECFDEFEESPSEPTVEVDCVVDAEAFYGSEDDLLTGEGVMAGICPEGLPGDWTECPTECAAGMQAALDELDCCYRDYLAQFAPPESGDYPDLAFSNVIPLCQLDLTNAEGECFDEFEPVVELDCAARGGAFFGSAADLIQGPNVTTPCPTTEGLPGQWVSCSATCAAGMQAALDELDCCFREYLEDFVDDGDLGNYADMAFSNIIPLCELDISGTASQCFSEFRTPTEQCFAEARQFFASDDDLIRNPNLEESPCPTNRPGDWDVCSPECATGLQAAVDELDCCVREYLNEFAGPNFDHGSYTDRAFAHAIPLCDIDLSGTNSACFDQFRSEANEQCVEDAAAFYESADDLVNADPSPCPSGMPGQWDVCSLECADAMQSALDELDCCFRDYLDEFAGPGDHGDYADRALVSVVPLCNLEVSESSCFDEVRSLNAASTISTTLTFVATFIGSAIAWSF